jgi:hypothetical protein
MVWITGELGFVSRQAERLFSLNFQTSSGTHPASYIAGLLPQRDEVVYM